MTSILLATVTGLSLGAPLDPHDVASDATWILHVDLERAFASSLGALVVDPAQRKVTFGVEPDEALDTFKSDYGVDPLTDLHSVTMFGHGADPREGVVLVKANSTIGHLVTRFATPEHGHQMVSIAGRDLHAWTQGGETHYVHVGGTGEDKRVLFSQSTSALTEAIDVLEAGHASFEGTVAPSSGSIVYAMSIDPASLAKAGFQSNFLARMDSIVMDLGEESGDAYARLSLTAPDADQAGQMAGMAQGMLAVGRMMAPDDPRVREAMKILDAVSFDVDGRDVRISCTCPASKLKSLMQDDD
ncbi:MAG: hypothetical protein KDA28_13235 [Phycisphaerales bacterium]|nr:hypothetical protein [Phycisphaerales bacterium]